MSIAVDSYSFKLLFVTSFDIAAPLKQQESSGERTTIGPNLEAARAAPRPPFTCIVSKHVEANGAGDAWSRCRELA